MIGSRKINFNQPHCMMRTLRHLSLLTLLTATVAHAQIPNGGFEDWTDFGTYEDPAGWTSLNALTTTFGGVLSCEQAVPAAEGSYGVTVTSRDIPGFGLFPGLLLTGDAEASADGFPYTARPQALNGMWKAAIASGDDGAVVIVATPSGPQADADLAQLSQASLPLLAQELDAIRAQR